MKNAVEWTRDQMETILYPYGINLYPDVTVISFVTVLVTAVLTSMQCELSSFFAITYVSYFAQLW